MCRIYTFMRTKSIPYSFFCTMHNALLGGVVVPPRKFPQNRKQNFTKDTKNNILKPTKSAILFVHQKPPQPSKALWGFLMYKQHRTFRYFQYIFHVIFCKLFYSSQSTSSCFKKASRSFSNCGSYSFCVCFSYVRSSNHFGVFSRLIYCRDLPIFAICGCRLL